jgi:hypothetical protein
MCEFDWELFSKFLAPILAFFAGYIPVFYANIKRTQELKAELKINNSFKQIELDYKRAEFIYTQKHKGYEDLLKTISKYSIETNNLIVEDFLLEFFNFYNEKAICDEDEKLELIDTKFREKFSSISKKYNELYNSLTIEIQPSILNSSEEVYSLIENVKNDYKLIYKKFINKLLPNLNTLSSEDIDKHNSEIKLFFEEYELSFERLKIQMRKEIKKEESKIKK